MGENSRCQGQCPYNLLLISGHTVIFHLRNHVCEKLVYPLFGNTYDPSCVIGLVSTREVFSDRNNQLIVE